MRLGRNRWLSRLTVSLCALLIMLPSMRADAYVWAPVANRASVVLIETVGNNLIARGIALNSPVYNKTLGRVLEFFMTVKGQSLVNAFTTAGIGGVVLYAFTEGFDLKLDSEGYFVEKNSVQTSTNPILASTPVYKAADGKYYFQPESYEVCSLNADTTSCVTSLECNESNNVMYCGKQKIVTKYNIDGSVGTQISTYNHSYEINRFADIFPSEIGQKNYDPESDQIPPVFEGTIQPIDKKATAAEALNALPDEDKARLVSDSAIATAVDAIYKGASASGWLDPATTAPYNYQSPVTAVQASGSSLNVGDFAATQTPTSVPTKDGLKVVPVEAYPKEELEDQTATKPEEGTATPPPPTDTPFQEVVIPEAEDDETFAKKLFAPFTELTSPLTNIDISVSEPACQPIQFQLEFFNNKTFATSYHCDFMDDNKTFIGLIALLFYLMVAVRIILSA